MLLLLRVLLPPVVLMVPHQQDGDVAPASCTYRRSGRYPLRHTRRNMLLHAAVNTMAERWPDFASRWFGTEYNTSSILSLG